jgi:Chondroitinase B
MSIDYQFLGEAMKHAKPGDAILLKNATITSSNLDISCCGALDRPVTIMPDDPCGVVVSRNASVTVSGSHVILSHFKFRGATREVPLLSVTGDNVRVASCVFENNPGGRVSIGHAHARLDHCVMKTMSNLVISVKSVILDHNDISFAGVTLESEGNAVIWNSMRHTTVHTKGASNMFFHNTMNASVVEMCAPHNIVFRNAFEDSRVSYETADAGASHIVKNVFVDAKTSVVTEVMGIQFKNNVIIGDGHVFLPSCVAYSSNALFAHTPAPEVVPGVIHQGPPHAAPSLPGKTYGHDPDHFGLFDEKNNMSSTQLFMPVGTFNRSLADTLRDRV